MSEQAEKSSSVRERPARPSSPEKPSEMELKQMKRMERQLKRLSFENPGPQIANFNPELRQLIKKGQMPTKSEFVPVKREVNKYEQKGRPVKREVNEYDQKGRPVKREVNEYDQKGRLVKREVNEYEQKGRPVKREVNEYEQRGRPVKREVNKYEQKGRPVKREVNKYDQKGRLTFNQADLCDCLDEDCPGCFYPCPKCNSTKCGPTCRCNRRWAYRTIVDESGEVISKMPFDLSD